MYDRSSKKKNKKKNWISVAISGAPEEAKKKYCQARLKLQTDLDENGKDVY